MILKQLVISGICLAAVLSGFGSNCAVTPEASGRENRAALQALLDRGGTVRIDRPGRYKIAGTLFIGSNTTLDCVPGVVFEKSDEGGAFSHVLCNKGALTKTFDENITVRGLEIAVNGMDVCDWSVAYGLRGQLAFFYAKNVTVENFKCLDLGRGQFGLHFCTFENVVVDNADIRGWKDGVHFGRGVRFRVSRCTFDTGDDPIALNAHDYATSNPELGWISEGLIEDCRDLRNDEKKVGFFCRILAGSWGEWTRGMQVRQSDSVIRPSGVYRVSMKPDGRVFVANAAPESKPGLPNDDGIVWRKVQDDPVTSCGVSNIVFRSLRLDQPRPLFSFHIDDDKFSRSCYPGTSVPDQTGIRFENVKVGFAEKTPAFVFKTPVAGLTFKDCDFGNCTNVSSPLAWNDARQPLWPEGKIPNFQAHQIGAMGDEVNAADFKADEHRMPYLKWSEKPSNPNGTCMILISGGSYNGCTDVNLIKLWKERFTAIGCQTVTLVYRTPRPRGLAIYQSAWQDGQRAVRLVRAEAVKRGYDPEKIGTMSMSAGSHLNVLLSTSSQTAAYEPVDELDTTVSCHVNWAITGAIAYGLSDGFGIPNARQGDGSDITLDPAFKFDAKTAPMCMFHGGLDAFSPLASTQVYRQLRRMKVPAELHLYADRQHGFWGWNPDRPTSTGSDNWFGRAHEFMVQMGFLGPVPAEVDIMQRYSSDVPYAYQAKEEIWPKGRMPDVQTNQCTPYLQWYVPLNLTTKAIQIIYSGGGYGGNDPDGFEVAPMRRFLNEKGMAVVTMKYRTPRPVGLQKHVTAWQDLQRAIRIVRAKAPELGLDPDRIGLMGSSAGGHLTLMGVTSSRHQAYNPIDALDKIKCNVQWAIGIYPAYVLTDGGEQNNTTGGNDDSARLVAEFSFDPDTCPMVFIHGDADGWAAMNSVKVWEQMRRMGVQSDLHTLCLRPHCFQRKAAPGTGSYTWMERAWEFMNHKGINR